MFTYPDGRVYMNHETRSSTRISELRRSDGSIAHEGEWDRNLRHGKGKGYSSDSSNLMGILWRISKWNRKRVSGWRDTLLSGKLKQNLKMARERSIPMPVTLFLKEISNQDKPMVKARSSVKMDHPLIQVDSLKDCVRAVGNYMEWMGFWFMRAIQSQLASWFREGIPWEREDCLWWKLEYQSKIRPWGSLREMSSYFSGKLIEDLPEGSGKEFRKDGSLLFEGSSSGNTTWFRKNYFPDGTVQYDGEFSKVLSMESEKVPSWWNSDLWRKLLNGRRDGNGKPFLKRRKVLKDFLQRDWLKEKEWIYVFVQGRFSEGQRHGKGRYFLPAISSFMTEILLKIPDMVMELNSGKMVQYYQEILNSVPDMRKIFFGRRENTFWWIFWRRKAWWQRERISFRRLLAFGEFIKGEKAWIGFGTDANFSTEIFAKEVARWGNRIPRKWGHSSAVHFSKINATGTIYGPDEAIVFKETDQGKPQGAGQEFLDDGTMVYDGNFVEGQRQAGETVFDAWRIDLWRRASCQPPWRSGDWLQRRRHQTLWRCLGKRPPWRSGRTLRFPTETRIRWSLYQGWTEWTG